MTPPIESPPLSHGFARSFDSLATDWVTFPQHYLLYVSQGTFRLEVAQAQWLLPPQRAAWIGAGVPIKVSSRGAVTSCSVLFAADALPAPPLPCQVFTVSALAREMFLHAMRWGPERSPNDVSADRFLLSLAEVCRELAATPDQFWLPQGRSPELRRAMEHTVARLGEPLQPGDVARTVGPSPRTLARRFAEEAAMPWRAFLQRARLIAAMELLGAREEAYT